MHSDHLVGLSDTWDSRGRPIYCSHVTAALLSRKFPKLAERADVRVLARRSTHFIFSGLNSRRLNRGVRT